VPFTVVTATTGTMTTTYSQVAAGGTSGGGGGVPSSKMNAGEHAITQQPHGSHTHNRQAHGKEYRGWLVFSVAIINYLWDVNCFFSGGGGGVSNGHRLQWDNSGGHNKGNHRSKGPCATAAETGLHSTLHESMWF